MIGVVVEHEDGKIKKASLEALTFGQHISTARNTSCAALVFGKMDDMEQLGNYGANEVYVVNSDVQVFDAQQITNALYEVAANKGINTFIFNHSANGKTIAGRVAVKLDADVVTGVSEFVSADEGLVVKRPLYAGKTIGTYKMSSPNSVITLMGNAIQPQYSEGNECSVENLGIGLSDSVIQLVKTDKVKGEIPLPEAELVVSAGRGMKGPENWGIIEELAETLGATTACSRPVADLDWRPHHEHVGQTGIAIRPNLYIAIGISGAIQHLAGVNNSKVIVVINKDPEAPFFKAADYGICADLFDVVPKLTAALKEYKANHN